MLKLPRASFRLPVVTHSLSKARDIADDKRPSLNYETVKNLVICKCIQETIDLKHIKEAYMEVAVPESMAHDQSDNDESVGINENQPDS